MSMLYQESPNSSQSHKAPSYTLLVQLALSSHLRSPLAHPTSLVLTHRRPLDRSSHPRVPWSARPTWAPTTASFLAVAQNQGKATLKMTLKLSLPPSSSPILSFLNLSRHPLSVVVVCRLARSYSTSTLRVKHLRSKLTKPQIPVL
jgi:hypothetical protein